jgi:hypothetical protein
MHDIGCTLRDSEIDAVGIYTVAGHEQLAYCMSAGDTVAAACCWQQWLFAVGYASRAASDRSYIVYIEVYFGCGVPAECCMQYDQYIER